MLILIAGATGKLGQNLITSCLNRNYQVRALCRNPDKIPFPVRDQLESLVTPANYYDIPALDKACMGIDAIIVAYTGIPELQLDAQLLLLRAAERAGITKFVAQSWNYDWRAMELGQHESYDPFLCFRRHVDLTSGIRPVYVFTGVLAEVLFSTFFTTKYNGIWDEDGHRIVTYGTGEEEWHVTTYADAAEYTVEILELPDIEKGGFFSVSSFVHSSRDIARIYGETRGIEVPVVLEGSVDDLRKVALAAREKTGDPKNYYEYIGFFYQLFTLDGTWVLKELDNDRFPGVKPTSLEQLLTENPEL